MSYNQGMGIDTLAFIDTDLHGLSPKDFHLELERRIGKKIYLRGFGESPYPNLHDEGDVWSLCCDEYDFDEACKRSLLVLRYHSHDFFINLGYHNNTFEIEDLEIKGKDLSLFHHRFNGFCRLLSEDTKMILLELKELIDTINLHIRPITHSTRVFLCGDQVYTDGKELLADKIDEGLSIDQAIEFEANSIEPNPLYTWDNLDILMKDYIGWGIFDFDLDNLPKYITSIQ